MTGYESFIKRLSVPKPVDHAFTFLHSDYNSTCTAMHVSTCVVLNEVYYVSPGYTSLYLKVKLAEILDGAKIYFRS